MAVGNDIFGRQTVFGGAMSAEATKVAFTAPDVANFSNVGLIMQKVELQYQQNITRLYALEDSSVYFVAGRTEGQMSVGHIVGPKGLQKQFITTYGDVCQAGDKSFILSMSTACGTQTAVTEGTLAQASVEIGNPVITGIALSIEAQQMLIMSNLSMMFTWLSFAESGS